MDEEKEREKKKGWCTQFFPSRLRKVLEVDKLDSPSRLQFLKLHELKHVGKGIKKAGKLDCKLPFKYLSASKNLKHPKRNPEDPFAKLKLEPPQLSTIC